MATGLRLRNKSTGDEETFRFEGDIRNLEKAMTVKEWIEDTLPEVSKLVTEENFIGFGDYEAMEMCVPNCVDTVDDVKKFLDRRNADAEWDIPEGMLYVDWLACMNILDDYLDCEYVTYGRERICASEYDVEDIDGACERLTKEGRHLVCHKHVIKDAYTREYEDEVIQ